jgi:type I restriction enzyme S subunit
MAKPQHHQRNGASGSIDVPQGWAPIKLENCVEILDSLRVPVNSTEREKRRGDVPYYGATGQVGWIDDFLFDEELVLIGEDGAPFLDKSKPIAYIIRGKSWVNNHAHVLRAISALTRNKFIKYQLDHVDFTEQVNGTTRLKLTQSAMRSLPILLPPLAEQERIVEKVEALLTRVKTARESLARVSSILKRFRQSVLAAACSGHLTRGNDAGWTTKLLKDLLLDPPQNGLYKPQSSYGSGTPIVRIDDFHDGKLRPSESLKRLVVSRDEVQKYRLNEGELLINRVNSLKFLGKSLVVPRLREATLFESNMMRCSVNESLIDADYLGVYLRSPRGTDELLSGAKHAVNQASINQTDVGKVQVPHPGVEEQRLIVRRVGALFKLADVIERRIADATVRAEKLTKSILAKAFRGELVPTEAEVARREGRQYEPASALLARIEPRIGAKDGLDPICRE